MRPDINDRDQGHLDDILEWGEEIRNLLRNKKLTDYVKEPATRAATERWIELIGEASKSLSQSFRDVFPDIPWEDVIGMRDFLAHQYARVDHAVVWDTAGRGIPDLIKMLKRSSTSTARKKH